MPALPSGSVPVGSNSDVFSSAIAPSIAALRSGVSRRSPSGAAKTRFSTPPCSAANSDSIRSVAFCVSEPGILNSSRSSPPTVATVTMRTAMIPTHAQTTRHGCDAHARIQRASPPVDSRSWAASRSEVGSAAASPWSSVVFDMGSPCGGGNAGGDQKRRPNSSVSAASVAVRTLPAQCGGQHVEGCGYPHPSRTRA